MFLTFFTTHCLTLLMCCSFLFNCQMGSEQSGNINFCSDFKIFQPKPCVCYLQTFFNAQLYLVGLTMITMDCLPLDSSWDYTIKSNLRLCFPHFLNAYHFDYSSPPTKPGCGTNSWVLHFKQMQIPNSLFDAFGDLL